MNFTILRFDSLPSTNDEAARQARAGAAEGVCVIAQEQTKGRGRRERTWHSPLGAGLYFSVVLRPRFPQKIWSLITLAAAAAICDALRESYGLSTDIKWANDIHTPDGKKLAGILAETVDTPRGKAVILGIGINLRKEAVAPHLSEIAASIETETNFAPDFEALLAALTLNLRRYYSSLHEPNDGAKIIDAWTKRSSYANGKSVRVMLENEVFDGETCGLNEDGALRVATQDGIIKTVYAGDVLALRSLKL